MITFVMMCWRPFLLFYDTCSDVVGGIVSLDTENMSFGGIDLSLLIY